MPDLTEHRMLPGSHETQDGPQCRCGAAWDRWNDRCAMPMSEPMSEERKAQIRELLRRGLYGHAYPDMVDLLAEIDRQAAVIGEQRSDIVSLIHHGPEIVEAEAKRRWANDYPDTARRVDWSGIAEQMQDRYRSEARAALAAAGEAGRQVSGGAGGGV